MKKEKEKMTRTEWILLAVLAVSILDFATRILKW